MWVFISKRHNKVIAIRVFFADDHWTRVKKFASLWWWFMYISKTSFSFLGHCSNFCGSVYLKKQERTTCCLFFFFSLLSLSYFDTFYEKSWISKSIISYYYRNDFVSIYLKWHCKMVSCRGYHCNRGHFKDSILKNNAEITGPCFCPWHLLPRKKRPKDSGWTSILQ